MHRFFVSKNGISSAEVQFSRQQTHQIRNVLRLKLNQKVIALDNEGHEYEVILTTLEKDSAIGRIIEKRLAKGEPDVQITLFQSLLARDKFEWVLQKCTEVGVCSFVPVLTERTIVRNTSIKPGKLDRWKQIITEAAEQAHRGKIPNLLEPLSFQEAILTPKKYDRMIIAYECEQSTTLRQALESLIPQKTNIAVFIGPEGGFADHEIQLAGQNGVMPVGLGPRILRTETAAIVTTALILNELG